MCSPTGFLIRVNGCLGVQISCGRTSVGHATYNRDPIEQQFGKSENSTWEDGKEMVGFGSFLLCILRGM